MAVLRRENTGPISGISTQTVKEGFGSYLDGILPDDIATACGAFGASMQQVRNIKEVPIEKFAQVVTQLETMNGLDVNGTSIPTNVTLANQGSAIIALGSGPYGSYTMSDMLGAMSGLPYINDLMITQRLITKLSTTQLSDTYRELYLAVTWEQATASVQYTTTSIETPAGSGNFIDYYTVTGITLTDNGGGYLRNNTGTPTITINGNAGDSATLTVGVDPNNITTYGRVTSINATLTGNLNTFIPTATISIPPDNGTGGWPGMNTIVQSYIDSANNQIANIRTLNPALSTELNNAWYNIGLQLKREQRARYIGMPPLGTRDIYDPLSMPPMAQYSFIDQLNYYAMDTKPHMYAQTLEAITDWRLIGGRSIIGSMREARNEDRLSMIGVPLDNGVPYTPGGITINNQHDKILVANGPSLTTGISPFTVTGGIVNDKLTVTNFTGTLKPGLSLSGCGPIVTAGNFITGVTYHISSLGNTNFMIIGSPSNTVGTQFIATGPGSGTGTANPCIKLGTVITSLLTSNGNTNTYIVSPSQDIPNNTIITVSSPNEPIQRPSTLKTTDQNNNLIEPKNQGYYDPTYNRFVFTDPEYSIGSGTSPGVGILDTGKAKVPGSLAGNPYQNLLLPTLNTVYSSSQLSPSVPTLNQALDTVNEHNCDCWI